jgi:hypothetical protein
MWVVISNIRFHWHQGRLFVCNIESDVSQHEVRYDAIFGSPSTHYDFGTAENGCVSRSDAARGALINPSEIKIDSE